MDVVGCVVDMDVGMDVVGRVDALNFVVEECSNAGLFRDKLISSV